MFTSFRNIFTNFLDFLTPLRRDYAIVKNLNEKSFAEMPRSFPVFDMDWVHPLFPYKNSKIKAVIWELKYRENTKPLEYIGKFIYDEIIALVSDILLFNTDAEFLLIPIPISLERRKERGYNQSEYIAKAVLENDHERILLYAPQWFLKIKETAKQSRSQSKSEREKNLVGCFEANPRVDGKYIILIDDVVTTGSTLSEARKTLISARARDVFAFTVAH